jgi:hypothetical protein
MPRTLIDMRPPLTGLLFFARAASRWRPGGAVHWGATGLLRISIQMYHNAEKVNPIPTTDFVGRSGHGERDASQKAASGSPAPSLML